MNKANNPDIVPVRTKTNRTTKVAKQPQVLDLRPGHIRAVAAMKEQEAKRATRLATVKSDTHRTVAASSAKPIPRAGSNRPVKPTSVASNDVQAAVISTQSITEPKTSAATKGAKQNTGRKRKGGFKPEKIARKMRKQLDKTTVRVVNHGKKFIVNRWDHIRLARRSVVLWLCLIFLLIVGSFAQTIYYGSLDTTVTAVSGGTYAEGTTDKLTTISPLHASTSTEKAASQLV